MARVSQEEMDRRIEAYGGSSLAHSPTTSKKKIPNPAHKQNGGSSWTVDEEIEVEVQRWKGPGATGADLEAYQLPDGSWEIVKEQPATPSTSTTAASTRPAIPPGGSSETEGTPIKDANGNITGWDNNRPRQVIKDKNGTVVWTEELTGADLTAWRAAQQANQPQTGEVRKPVEGRPGWTQITRATTQGGNKTEATVYVGPDGKEVPTLPAVPGAPTLKPDGKGGTIAVQAMPDGTIKTTPLPGVPSEATTKYTEVKQDPATGAWHGFTKDGRWEPIQGGPGREQKPGQLVTVNGETFWAQPDPTNPGAPPRLTRASDLPGAADKPPPTDNGPQMAPGQSPSQYLAARRQWYIDQRRAGTMTQAQVTDSWERDKEIAQATQNEATTAATQQNQRLATSMSGFNSAMSEIGTLNRYLPVGSDLGGRALEATLGLQYAQAQRMGGYGATPAPLAIPPAPNEPDPSSQVAAIPPLPAPAAASEVAPLAPDERAGMAAEQARRGAAMANPVFRPTAPVGSPTFSTAGGGFMPAGSAAAPNAPPSIFDRTMPGTPPAVQGTPSPLGDTGAPPVSAIPESPYAFQARIASTPPWMLEESDWEQARRMGLEDQFWKVA